MIQNKLLGDSAVHTREYAEATDNDIHALLQKVINDVVSADL